MSEACEVLFVDDEPNVLSGLRRMLRGMRREWSMEFVGSAAEALEVMANRSIDVIVSDVRMPVTDGIELLDMVRQRHPEMIRIILSGHSDHVATLRATGVAHQYLAKPCDSDALQSAVRRSLSLRTQLADNRLASAIAGTKTLPAAPKVYDKLTSELANQEPDIKKIATIVSTDPALAAKILQVVNSAFFALRREVTSVDQAVSLLGMKTVAGLALTAGVFESPQMDPRVASIMNAVRDRSLKAAHVAKSIALAETGNAANGDAAFLAGILHDCGKLIVGLNWPDEFVDVEHGDASLAMERVRYGLDHALAGAYLLGVWGLPDEIVEAVAYHHHPSEGGNPDAFGTTAALHIALAMIDLHDDGDTYQLDEPFVAALGKSDRVDAWQGLVEDYEYEMANR